MKRRGYIYARDLKVGDYIHFSVPAQQIDRWGVVSRVAHGPYVMLVTAAMARVKAEYGTAEFVYIESDASDPRFKAFASTVKDLASSLGPPPTDAWVRTFLELEIPRFLLGTKIAKAVEDELRAQTVVTYGDGDDEVITDICCEFMTPIERECLRQAVERTKIAALADWADEVSYDTDDHGNLTIMIDIPREQIEEAMAKGEIGLLKQSLETLWGEPWSPQEFRDLLPDPNESHDIGDGPRLALASAPVAPREAPPETIVPQHMLPASIRSYGYTPNPEAQRKIERMCGIVSPACPECKGSGAYVGFTDAGQCTACGGTGRA